MDNGMLRAAMAAFLLIGLVACGSMPGSRRPMDRIDYHRLRPISIASIEGAQVPSAAVVRWINPSLIRADVMVSDILRPDFGSLGAGDPERVRATIRFTAPALTGTSLPVRFDPETASIECHSGDATIPTTRLEFRDNAYTALVSKGRRFPDRLPSYLWCRMRVGEAEYDIARVPLVHSIGIRTPAAGSEHLPDEDVVAALESDSYETLWSNNDHHFMFRHENTVTTTERSTGGETRIVGGAVRPGTHRAVQGFRAPPIPPYATSGSVGHVYAMTRYTPDEYTLGPTHFMMTWTSISGATPVPIRWR
jgi:hypothetical protein